MWFIAGASRRLSQALAMEVEPFGIKVTVVQPGGYATDLFTRGTTATEPDPLYEPVRARPADSYRLAQPEPENTPPAK